MKLDNYEELKLYFIQRYSLRVFTKKERLVLVEGWLDVKFFNKLKCEDVKYIDIDSFVNDLAIVKSNDDYYPNHKEKQKKDFPNNKKYLVKFFSEKDYEVSRLIENLNMFGIVDRDDGDEFPKENCERLISNDTTDLETMMLRRDKNLVQDISILSMDSNLIHKAKFMAYQLSLLIGILKKNNLRYERVEFNKVNNYFDGYKLNIFSYLDYVADCQKKYNQDVLTDVNEILKKIETDLIMQGFLDFQTNEKELNFEEFLREEPQNFWQIVNGHDLLQIILSLNIKNENFKNLFKFREFETFLVKNYDLSNFNLEPLCRKMKKYKIIN